MKAKSNPKARRSAKNKRTGLYERQKVRTARNKANAKLRRDRRRKQWLDKGVKKNGQKVR